MKKEDQRVYFISDLHLSESRDDLLVAFFRFLERIQEEQGTDLYILGDFFNFWAGDDIQPPFVEEISSRLKQLQTLGVSIFFQHGNRDFSLGKIFADQSGMLLIPEYYVLPFASNILVIHGDQLCTFDEKYQRYRKWIRHPFVLTLLRKLPKAWRLRLANKIRNTSKAEKLASGKSDLYRVDDNAVNQLFDQYNVDTIIHGHTHSPALHMYDHKKRYVLSDWENTGDYLIWTPMNGIERVTFEI